MGRWKKTEREIDVGRIAAAYAHMGTQEEMFKEAGVSRATFYRYLPVAVERGLVQLRDPQDELARARKSEARKGKPSQGGRRRLSDAISQFVSADEAYLTADLDERGVDERVRQAVLNQRRVGVERLIEFLKAQFK